jgi:hypothetical protein
MAACVLIASTASTNVPDHAMAHGRGATAVPSGAGDEPRGARDTVGTPVSSRSTGGDASGYGVGVPFIASSNCSSRRYRPSSSTKMK